MNHDVLKTVIYDQHNLIRNFHIVDREYDFDLNANYVLVGLRRAGKSTLLYKIVQDLIASGKQWNQIVYINFEDERLADFTLNDFNDILSVKAEMTDEEGWFFLDEIQNVEGWEKFARRMADSKQHTFITGSNARMLSQEIESHLGGRYLTKYVTPYNFREFLTAKQIDYTESSMYETQNNGKIRREMETYSNFGGFPENLSFRDKREYVSSIYQKILLGDIATRNGIRNSSALRILMKKLGESVKDELSYSKLHNLLKTIGVNISKDVVIDYVGYACSAFLIFAIRNYYSKFVERETTPKYYFNDNGILNLFLCDEESRLLENLVAINLWNRYRDGVYYLKGRDVDVDFYVEETGSAIQVAYEISSTSSDREIRSLVNVAKTMKDSKRFVIITHEEEREFVMDGIKIEVIPIWKWLIKN